MKSRAYYGPIIMAGALIAVLSIISVATMARTYMDLEYRGWEADGTNFFQAKLDVMAVKMRVVLLVLAAGAIMFFGGLTCRARVTSAEREAE